jgi:hypothetical protein
MEEFVPGRTENLHDYLIPTVGDVPPIKTYLIEDPEPLGPFGAKGVGEPALVATAPAILGAIRHATGVRVTRVPALPHRVWEALQRSPSPLWGGVRGGVRSGGRAPGWSPHPSPPPQGGRELLR